MYRSVISFENGINTFIVRIKPILICKDKFVYKIKFSVYFKTKQVPLYIYQIDFQIYNAKQVFQKLNLKTFQKRLRLLQYYNSRNK